MLLIWLVFICVHTPIHLIDLSLTCGAHFHLLVYTLIYIVIQSPAGVACMAEWFVVDAVSASCGVRFPAPAFLVPFSLALRARRDLADGASERALRTSLVLAPCDERVRYLRNLLAHGLSI